MLLPCRAFFVMGRLKKEKKKWFHLEPDIDPIPDQNVACVYKIRFKDRYYIGRARNLQKRMGQHEADIIRQERFWSTHPDESSYYKKLLDFIVENNVTVGFYSVLQVCQTELDLVQGEQKWFDQCRDDPKCLNVGFVAKAWVDRKKGEKPIEPTENDEIENWLSV